MIVFQQRRLGERKVGSTAAAPAKWSDRSEEATDAEPSPRRTQRESGSRAVAPESRAAARGAAASSSSDFKLVDNNEEYQPTYRKDFVHRDPSPPKEARPSLTPSSLLTNVEREEVEEKPRSLAPQIDERSNRFGSLLRNFQTGAKGKQSESPPAQGGGASPGVGRVKVASIFDRDDPLEEEERERKRTTMRDRVPVRSPGPAHAHAHARSPSGGSRTTAPAAAASWGERAEELRPHVLKKRQWEQLRQQPLNSNHSQVRPNNVHTRRTQNDENIVCCSYNSFTERPGRHNHPFHSPLPRRHIVTPTGGGSILDSPLCHTNWLIRSTTPITDSGCSMHWHSCSSHNSF